MEPQKNENKAIIAHQKTEQKLDNIFSIMTEEEIIELAENYEQDIYLELY